MHAERRSGFFASASRYLLLSLCLILVGHGATAQVVSQGLTQLSGTLTQAVPPSGIGTTWNVTGTINSTVPGTSTIVNLTERQGSWYIMLHGAGTISSSGVLTYTLASSQYYLPFGTSPCTLAGTANISATSYTETIPGTGSGCSSTITITLYGTSGQLNGAPPSQHPDNCPTCSTTNGTSPTVDFTPIPPMNNDIDSPSQVTEGVSGHAGSSSLSVEQAGNLVNVATGNVFESVTDYKTAGPNVLALKRYYNSQPATSTYAQSMGQQWRTNYDRYLNIAPSYLIGYIAPFGLGSTNVIAERPDGRQMIFGGGSSGYATDPDNDATLTNSGSTWVLTLHDDTVETYTAVGGEAKLTSIKMRGGYTETLAYNGSGQLATVTDTYGRTLTFTYTSGLLTQVTTPDSLILTYGYNSSGIIPGVNDRLVSVSYNTSPVTSQTYNYTTTGLPFSLTSITDEDGNSFASWTYDNNNRALTSQFGTGTSTNGLTTFVYSTTANTTKVTNSLGSSQTYTYLFNGNKTTVLSVARGVAASGNYQLTYDNNNFVPQVEDWNSHYTQYTNNSHGDPTTIIEAATTPIARTTTITYDTTWVHLPATVVTPGLTTSYTYDTNGNVLTKTETDTTTTTVPYSTNGQTRTWTYTWLNYLPHTVKSPNGNTTTYTFDSTGALTGVTNALGQTTSITSHTGGGRPLTITDPNGVLTTLTYSPRNWLLTKAVTTTAGVLTTTNSYDAAGNLTKVTEPDGSYFIATFDTGHQLTQLADSFGNSVNYTRDAAGDILTSKTENPSGTVTTSHSYSWTQPYILLSDTSGTGFTNNYGYDPNANLTTYDLPQQPHTLSYDALNRFTQDASTGYLNFTYDAHDCVLTATDRDSHVTNFVCDGFGEPIQEVNVDTGTTVWHYDADGNATSKLDAMGVTTNHTYDALDRVLTTTYPASAGENVAYTYDQTGAGFAFGIGRLTSVTDQAGSLTRSYDERGNLITDKRVSGTTTLTTSYGYDAASNLASITYPSGALVTYIRDAMGRITSATAKPSGASSATTIASAITYEPLGPWLTLTYGNGIAETVTYDLAYKPLTLKDIGTATVQNLTYTYPTSTAGLVGVYTDAVTPAYSLNNVYDGMYREWQLPGVGIYYMDPNENRSSKSVPPAATLGYTAGNHIATITPSGGSANTVTTSANGNITAFSLAYGSAGVTGLSYNNANRLSSVSGASGTLGSYIYDAFGNRFSKTVGTATTLYTSAPDMTLLEETTAGTATDYIYLNGRPIAMLTGTSFTYLHGNNLGTPLVATNAAQAVVWRTGYMPFGETISTTGTATVNLRMPGQYYDAESGLNHNGFRDYVPALGRYIEADPIGWDGGPNPYSYVHQNPLNHTDPMGLANWDNFGPNPSPEDQTNNRIESYWNPPGQTYSYSGHGQPSGPLDPNKFSPFGGASSYDWDTLLNELYKHGYFEGQPIIFHTCYAGAGGTHSFAQWFANTTGSTVIAADNVVNIAAHNGQETAAVGGGGAFWQFTPNNQPLRIGTTNGY